MLSRARLLILAYAAATAGAVGAFGASALSVGLPALFLALFADGVARPGSSVLYPARKRGPRQGRRVALSFDDGPDAEVTPAVLDALKSHDARATFFAIGRALEAQPELARRLAQEGHELGNHSFGHSRWMSFRMPRAQVREIERGERAIEAVTGRRTQPLYRAPFGIKSPPFVEAAHERQLTLVGWSLHSRDTRRLDPARIAERVLKRIRPGDIVLMHDGHDRPGRRRSGCAQALPLILRGLREKGLECVTVSELLRISAPERAVGSPASGAGSSRRPARP